MAKTPTPRPAEKAGAGERDDLAAADTATPRCWRWTAEYEMYVADLALHVAPGAVVEGDEPPTTHPAWVEDEGPATATPGKPAGSGFRTWTPEELQRGALAEDPPTTPGWEDPQPEPAPEPQPEPQPQPAADAAATDDQATEVDQ